MHKYYDPRMFDVLGEAAMRSCFDRTFDIAELPVGLKNAEDFSSLGSVLKSIELTNMRRPTAWQSILCVGREFEDPRGMHRNR